MRVRPGLRVLQVIYQDPVTYPPTINAARVLAAAGAEVLCLGYRRGPSVEMDSSASARIRYLNAGLPVSLPAILKRVGNVVNLRRETRREIERFRPDLVIAYDHGAGWGVAPFLRDRRFKAVLHLHDLLNVSVTRFTSSDGWMWAEMMRCATQFDLVVVPEAQRARYLREEWGMQVLPRIAANSPPCGHPARNDELRRRLVPSNPPGLLAVIVGNMGLYTETVRGVAAARGRWHLALVGCGHGPSISQVLDEARALRIEDRIHVFPYTSYDTVRTWLRGCDVGVGLYPSTSSNVNWRTMGSASVKVQEYMAAGLPSIVCSRETFANLARDCGALELLETETAESIAAALDRLEPGGEHHLRLARAALDAHLDRFNCEAQLQPILEELGLAPRGEAHAV
jgi:glycosyltransferase involved in cell wall biosynthesis